MVVVPLEVGELLRVQGCEQPRASAVPLGPIAAFVDESEVAVYVNIHQIYVRHVEPGQQAEVVLKPFPGKVFRGEVEYVVSDIAMGQVAPGGQLAVPRQALAVPSPATGNIRMPMPSESRVGSAC